MKILFGEVSGEYLESCLDDGSKMFECDGKYFDYCLEMNEECFVISDAIGRHMPIGVPEFKSAFKAMKIASNYARAINKYQGAVELVNDDEILYIE